MKAFFPAVEGVGFGFEHELGGGDEAAQLGGGRAASIGGRFDAKMTRLPHLCPKAKTATQASGRKWLIALIGMTGFEPATSRTPSERATRLRHIPSSVVSIYRIACLVK